MDKTLKRALEQAFGAPKPERKTAFLKAHRRRELGPVELLLTQTGYVRWWTWLGSCGLFAAILALASGSETGKSWSASGLTPLLALLAIAESGRSRRYGMAELELSCRMPRPAAVLARMTAVGILHLLLLMIAAPILAMWGGIGVLQTGVYLLTPYLATAAICMELSRRWRGQDGLLVCTAVAAIVCAVGELALVSRSDGYVEKTLPIWCVALAVAAVAAALEFVRMVKETEELQWN